MFSSKSQLSDERHAGTASQNTPGLSFGSWAFAFGSYSSDPWSFKRVCTFVSNAGYDGIEINGFRPHPHPDDFNTDTKCGKLRQQISDLGLGISAYAPDMTETPPAVASEKAYLRQVDSVRAFSERMGISILRVDSVSAPEELDPTEYSARFDLLASNFRAAASRLARSDVRLVWEFEPGFWLNKPSEVLHLVDAVDEPNFSILFDTSHALTSAMGRRQPGETELLAGGATEYARLLAPHVGHLHLIDSVGKLHDEETSEHLPFGTGVVEFDSVISALGKNASELDWWTVDFCFWPKTEIDGISAVPFVRELIGKDAGLSR